MEEANLNIARLLILAKPKIEADGCQLLCLGAICARLVSEGGLFVHRGPHCVPQSLQTCLCRLKEIGLRATVRQIKAKREPRCHFLTSSNPDAA